MMRASGSLPRVVVSCGRPDEASPLAEGEGELVTSDARCCWHPEVKQCGHRTVMQVAAPGRACRQTCCIRDLSCGPPPRLRCHHGWELVSGRQVA